MNAAAYSERAKRAAHRLLQDGQTLQPVNSRARSIATSFWGQAWCVQLASFEYYAGRLAPGRTYLKHGCVIDLQLEDGLAQALVAGALVYQVRIEFAPLAPERWQGLKEQASGQIESLLDLLQGKLPAELLRLVTHPERGLFPDHREIKFSCTCPDWADMCKHVAATLYGIGVRFDTNPELLFRLRAVDPQELLKATAHAELDAQQAGAALSGLDLSELFGIELDDG